MGKPKRLTVPQFNSHKAIPQSVSPGGRKAITASEPDWARSHPAWRIKSLELCEPYGWHRVGASKLNEIITKLSHFESMTWSEILVESKKQNHSVEIWKLEKPARDRLKELKLADEDAAQEGIVELVSLHLCGKERIWGYFGIDGKILNLLWWDPEHEVCPSSLRHT